MESQSNGTPDLAAVLKTLSSFNTPQPGQPQTNSTSQLASDRRLDNTNRTHTPFQANSVLLLNGQESRSGPQGKGSVDPSTITTWPAAIKYVMKTVAQNETVQYRIRRLIASQHEHERSWWQGRQTLLAKQKARAGNQRKLDEVLRAVGGKVTEQPHEAKPAEDELEIKRYDEKVYKASVEMSKALHSELKALGVPFFATKQELIQPVSSDDNSKLAEVNGSTETCITEEETRQLRLRMLELLQDLCKD
ncbi:hypothetical protein MferCBS31731_004664 [Microsporum ferrugineum]